MTQPEGHDLHDMMACLWVWPCGLRRPCCLKLSSATDIAESLSVLSIEGPLFRSVKKKRPELSFLQVTLHHDVTFVPVTVADALALQIRWPLVGGLASHRSTL